MSRRERVGLTLTAILQQLRLIFGSLGNDMDYDCWITKPWLMNEADVWYPCTINCIWSEFGSNCTNIMHKGLVIVWGSEEGTGDGWLSLEYLYNGLDTTQWEKQFAKTGMVLNVFLGGCPLCSLAAAVAAGLAVTLYRLSSHYDFHLLMAKQGWTDCLFSWLILTWLRSSKNMPVDPTGSTEATDAHWS